MNIAAITKYKHGNLYKLLQKLGWSQKELADRSGIHQSCIGQIINLQRRPNENTANAIQRAFGEAGEYLDVLEEWPDAFRLERGFKREEMADVPVGNLLYSKEMMALEFQSTAAPLELVEGVESAMSDLSEKERIALNDWIDERTLDETGKKLKLSWEGCRQIQCRAINKLRHPARIAKLNCDRADEIVEEGRKWAAGRKKEQEEEQARRIKQMAEEQATREYNQGKLDIALQKYPEVFKQIWFLSYTPRTPQCNQVISISRKRIVYGKENVLQFVRTYVDPEWPEDRDLNFDIITK